ncbi:hypothetical protein CIRG_06284 [Coccidioides immitis RMSCC 2394]|uniref:Uncharacterized protein n=1 Tax=Coccidioides immitis RMSCC 2394 TaxID=404692 RepID=A0A0J7B9C7_COCIT|nr:hypothetical protein CIRG_06284 [Coccidioides immitis RMSCC 2394]
MLPRVVEFALQGNAQLSPALHSRPAFTTPDSQTGEDRTGNIPFHSNDTGSKSQSTLETFERKLQMFTQADNRLLFPVTLAHSTLQPRYLLRAHLSASSRNMYNRSAGREDYKKRPQGIFGKRAGVSSKK